LTLKFDIPEPQWNSPLASIVLDLEKLRTRRLTAEIPPYIFFEIKNIFQMMERLGSARIEGNNTTLAELVEKVIDKGKGEGENNEVDEQQQELENIENAMAFIEKHTSEETQINRAYISELHKIVTYKLTPPPNGEGSNHAGELRKHDVSIKKSLHKPVGCALLQEVFDRFIEFINRHHLEQNQLLMVAIAHHGFTHIHPFDNGNGRTGRLLNYAFLIKLGFNVKAGRIINPSSIFYTDRDKYYDILGVADTLNDKDLLAWAEYFLLGLKDEIEKIDKLTKRDFVKDKLLIPAIKTALEREQITKQEFDILHLIIDSKEMSIKSADLGTLGIETTQQKTYAMQKLRDKKMVDSVREGGRIYTIKFANNYLLRGIMTALEENGFVAESLNLKRNA